MLVRSMPGTAGKYPRPVTDADQPVGVVEIANEAGRELLGLDRTTAVVEGRPADFQIAASFDRSAEVVDTGAGMQDQIACLQLLRVAQFTTELWRPLP